MNFFRDGGYVRLLELSTLSDKFHQIGAVCSIQWARRLTSLNREIGLTFKYALQQATTYKAIPFAVIKNGCEQDTRPSPQFSCRVVVRRLKQRRRRPQRERQESNRIRLAKQQLCTCITLLISKSSLHDYIVKTVCNFTFCGRREHKTTTFFFFSWTSIQSFRIQL